MKKENIIIYVSEESLDTQANAWDVEGLKSMAHLRCPTERILTPGAKLGGGNARTERCPGSNARQHTKKQPRSDAVRADVNIS